MNSLFRRLLIVALLAPAAALAAGFEGLVVFKLTEAKGKSQEMRYQVKGSKLRIEMPGQQGLGGMIVDPAKRETLVLMSEQKMYMVMKLPEDKAPAAGKAEDVKLEKSGRTETILGRKAEEFVATAKGEKTELWLAEGLGAFLSMPSNPMEGKGAAAPAWERALAGKDLFPLRIVSRGGNGKETFRLEATAITPQALPDSLFVAPAGYRKFDMGGMMQGMIPGLGR